MSTPHTLRSQPVYFLLHHDRASSNRDNRSGDHDRCLEQSIGDIPRQLPQRPNAILVVSDEWEEPAFTISSMPAPVTGAAPLSRRIRDLLDGAAFVTREAPGHGFDGGTLDMPGTMYPNSGIPVSRLSLRASLDPAEHWAAGRAVARLRDENVLIVGLGFRSRAPDRKTLATSNDFDTWLRRVLLDDAPSDRIVALINWQHVPAARVAHPRGHALMPLLFIAGAAGDDPATAVPRGRYEGRGPAPGFRFDASERRPDPEDVSVTATGRRRTHLHAVARRLAH